MAIKTPPTYVLDIFFGYNQEYKARKKHLCIALKRYIVLINKFPIYKNED